jgi:hypothetical protein
LGGHVTPVCDAGGRVFRLVIAPQRQHVTQAPRTVYCTE